MLTNLGLCAWMAALVITTDAVADELCVTTSAREIWRVDASTEIGTFVGDHGVALFDIAAPPSGELFGIDPNGGLYEIDSATAAANLVGTLNVGDDPGGWNSMDFNGSGTLFVARERLLTIDPTTAAATVVGSTGFSASGDIAFAPNGALYMSAETASDLDDLSR